MKKYLAEGLGTLVLVLVWCGTAVISGGSVGLLWIALAFGLAVTTMVYAIGNISGCHINPAISLAFFMRGDLSLKDLIGYIVAQCIGALLWAGLVMMLASDPSTLAANQVMAGYSVLSVLIAEAVFTALFIFVIFGATAKDGAGHLAWLIIGLTLTMGIMAIAPISNAALNPARAFGPAMLVGGQPLTELWLFIVGPAWGALIAVALWKCFHKK